MLSRVLVYLQYLLPQHLLSQLAGWIAESRIPWFKNFLITKFMSEYKIDLNEATIQNAEDFSSFNDFFIRTLKPGARPIAPEQTSIACPVDGTVAQIGRIPKNQLVQAKNIYFDLETLLGSDTDAAKLFYDGAFTTLYLAPNNYHRIHMPVTGTLTKTIYVPGKLFSVNNMTSMLIPNLYGRNERHISIFDTDAGPMAVILVGALIVGSIKTVWMNEPVRSTHILNDTISSNISLNKGDELGYFKLGSTVVLLFGKDKTDWSLTLQTGNRVKVGEKVGTIL